MKKIAESVLRAGLPMPGVVKPLARMLYLAGVGLAELLRWAYGAVVAGPVVKSLSEGGKRLRVERVPYIRGKGRIVIGSDVYISGQIGISFSRHAGQTPELIIGDRVFIGHECGFGVAGRITIGNDCLIGGGTRIQDNDGHPLDPEKRRAREPVAPENVRPVTIGNNVWIAPRATILKGVTIGENSIVGTGSVVTKDVPPNTVVAGNPAALIRELG